MSSKKLYTKLFGNLNISEIKESSDFKEDSVREVIILPLLNELGYNNTNIVRSKTLEHPYLKIGSKKRKIKLIPDYSIKVGENFAWILDAKSPSELIINSEHVEQAFSYAFHPEIRSAYFALCNGHEFSLFKTTSDDTPVLYFKLENIDRKWQEIKRFLSPNQFQLGKNYSYENSVKEKYTEDKLIFDYESRTLPPEFKPQKQKAKRHFGVHGYFTKQAWNVVAEYIKNFTQPGDLVLDPYGGSGVTAIEALMNERKAISIDINPLAIFMVDSLIAPINFDQFSQEFVSLKERYSELEPKTDEEIKIALTKYPYPKGIKLPGNSDVEFIEELYTDKQLAQLSLLKHLIKKVKDENIQKTLLLMFSGLLNKVNLTYHASKGRSAGRGNSSIFAYYRYRIAKDPAFIEILPYLESRFRKITNAKKEIEYFINKKTIKKLKLVKGSATNLSWIKDRSVDYIYTDPPYGAKIPYLDLSIMWNAWLDLEVTNDDYNIEAIEGGEKKNSKNKYNDLIAQSIKEMYRVLKYNRWLSFVFAHKDPEFWHLIIDTAESCGFEYVGATPQKNGQSSFKKRQNPFTVLSGQLIINFKKIKNPKAILRANLGMDIFEIMVQTIEGIIAKNDGATLEQINDEIIIKGLELGFLDLLKKEYSDITPLLLDRFEYKEESQKYFIISNKKFSTHIDVKLRIRYYLISFLTRKEREQDHPTFDQIILHIIPLLKNGSTPENQTVLSVLEDIAEHIGEKRWRLKRTGQLKLMLNE